MHAIFWLPLLVFALFPVEDQNRDGQDEKHDSKETKNDQYIDKLKHAAVTALSAAAVKAKLLACQEEDQIRQLATSLIEKQVIL